MLRNKYRLIVLALFALALNACATISANSGDQCLYFGENIKVFTELERFYRGESVKSELDFNGDGVKDRVVYLSVAKSSKIVEGVTISNPFINQRWEGAELSDEPHFAIGIIHNASQTTPCKQFILYHNVNFVKWSGAIDDFYKDQVAELSPSWISHRSLEIKNLKYDAISIWTPSSGQSIIFWNGKEYEAQIIDF